MTQEQSLEQEIPPEEGAAASDADSEKPVGEQLAEGDDTQASTDTPLATDEPVATPSEEQLPELESTDSQATDNVEQDLVDREKTLDPVDQTQSADMPAGTNLKPIEDLDKTS